MWGYLFYLLGTGLSGGMQGLHRAQDPCSLWSGVEPQPPALAAESATGAPGSPAGVGESSSSTSTGWMVLAKLAVTASLSSAQVGSKSRRSHTAADSLSLSWAQQAPSTHPPCPREDPAWHRQSSPCLLRLAAEAGWHCPPAAGGDNPHRTTPHPTPTPTPSSNRQ